MNVPARMPGRVNPDAALLDSLGPDAYQQRLALQQQAAMEQMRAEAAGPQTMAALQQQVRAELSAGDTFAHQRKEALKAAVGPEQTPGTQGVLAMAAQTPEGVDPRAYIAERIGMA